MARHYSYGMISPTLCSLSDDALLLRLAEILRDSRRVEADLVAHIAEVDARQLYLREACSSMFAYCVERLHLSEPETALRIHAARSSRRHPVLLEMLRDGRLHLSAIAVLAPHLTDENVTDVLRRAAHKTKAQLQELVAQLHPRPDAPTVIRKLPTPKVAAGFPVASGPERGGATSAPFTTAAPSAPSAPFTTATPSAPSAPSAPGTTAEALTMAAARNELRSQTALEHRLDDTVRRGDDPLTGPFRPQPQGPSAATRLNSPLTHRSIVEPLSPARYKVQFTASVTLKNKLERLQTLMLGSVPDGDLATVIEAAVTAEIDRLEAKRLAAVRTPRRSVAESDTRPGPRHIPAAVKRAVCTRDGNRCAYVDRQGRRCSERRHLQFHHRFPHGWGGDRSPENISLRCRCHNEYEAEQDYGRPFLKPRTGSSGGTRAVASQ